MALDTNGMLVGRGTAGKWEKRGDGIQARLTKKKFIR